MKSVKFVMSFSKSKRFSYSPDPRETFMQYRNTDSGRRRNLTYTKKEKDTLDSSSTVRMGRHSLYDNRKVCFFIILCLVKNCHFPKIISSFGIRLLLNYLVYLYCSKMYLYKYSMSYNNGLLAIFEKKEW